MDDDYKIRCKEGEEKMRIRVKIEKKTEIPNPQKCWMAELEYDNKPVELARRNVLMVAAEFCERTPFTDRRNLGIEFWDFSKRQVRERKGNGEVIYKIDNETISNLQLFIFGIVSTAKEFDGIEVLLMYLGRTIEVNNLQEARVFVDSLK